MLLSGVIIGLMVAAGVALAALAGYVWWRRGSSAGLSLAVLLLAAAWWASTYAMELSTRDMDVRSAWGDLKYVGIGVLPAALLVFAIQYTGRDRLVTGKRLMLLAIEPVVVWVLLAVPATHDLVRFYPPEELDERFPVVGSGPLFWPILAYSNVLLLTATVIFVISMVKLSRAYRVAAAVLVSAALLPWAANLLYNFAVGPFARIDLTPFAFLVTGAVLVWGLYRQRLINLSSLAWGVVVQTMATGVILRDAFGRVSDVNPAGENLLGRSRAELIGLDLAELLASSELFELTTETDTQVTVSVDGKTRHFELSHLPLPAPSDARSGGLVMLRDITAATESEATLRHLLAERTRIATTLQASLRPTRLPSIPGVRLAALYEPAGDGHEVGGDFYDVFPLGDDRWGIVLGDVSGKGAAAATTTALIRYTLRALATEHPQPDQVLNRLNTAMLSDDDPERFCTMIYGVAEVSEQGLDLRLCLAGHHQPLVRRGDGRVEPVGVLGTVLGLFPGPSLTSTSVHMDPGDLLFLCTDGLIEASGEDDLFGTERVTDILRHGQRIDPEPLLEHLAATVRDFHHGLLADDLALLALDIPSADARRTASGPIESAASARLVGQSPEL